MRRLLVLLIRAYRYMLSPFTASSCRYYPSCSAYAEEAMQSHGTWRGSWLAICRISRCHPGHAGGYDPVPPVGNSPDTGAEKEVQN